MLKRATLVLVLLLAWAGVAEAGFKLAKKSSQLSCFLFIKFVVSAGTLRMGQQHTWPITWKAAPNRRLI
jgi:hypothetical protein